MKTLIEHNTEALAITEALSRIANKAGVSCPGCEAELNYVGENTLTSIPPKRLVMCPECRFSGYKVI